VPGGGDEDLAVPRRRSRPDSAARHRRAIPHETLRQAQATVEAFAEDLDVEEVSISSEIGAHAF
jgi:hypothetical protein